jgi:hypothetical protein
VVFWYGDCYVANIMPKKIAARPVRRKPLSDIELRQLFTSQAAATPTRKDASSVTLSSVRIFSPSLLEKQDQKQDNYQ